MKINIGSYKQGIFELSIFENQLTPYTQINSVIKASYLMDFENTISYLYSKDNLQYIKLGDQDLLLKEGASHIYYDKNNNLIYVSFYGSGQLKVLAQKNKNWFISQTFEYGDKSHVHFAKYIESINMVGVCDLGLNEVKLFNIINNELVYNSTYKFLNNEGPRHFIDHPNEPILYILNELKPSISILEYKDDALVLIQTIKLADGAGSAIRMSKCGKYLFAAVRESNIIYSFEILENGEIKELCQVPSYGDHPRDFNLVLNDEYLLVANMNSDNLTLFKNENGILTLVEKNYYLNAGSSII